MTLVLSAPGWDEAAWIARFRAHAPDRAFAIWPDIADPASVRYLAAWYPDPDIYAHFPNLEAVFSLGAGVDHILRAPKTPTVPIARCVDPDLTNRMSEYIVLHALRILRFSDRYQADQQAGRWKPVSEQRPARDVRIGLMGLGVLGQDAARKLAMMGFQVAGWSRSPKTLEGLTTYAGAEDLSVFLGQTDILVGLLPLTQDTTDLYDYALFSQLAQNGALDGPHFINVGRGGSQVEADIIRALDDGVLASATLDVFQVEPLPETSPLWSHPGVTITPHVAADSAPEALVTLIISQMTALERGEPLQHVVDRASGY